jgi:membrane-bound lytic murein transglycosylase B
MHLLAVHRHSITLGLFAALMFGFISSPTSLAQTSTPSGAANSPALPSGTVHGDYPSRPEVRAFIRDMVVGHQFDEQELTSYFSEARHQARVVSLMTPPPPGARRSWTQYKTRVVDPYRVEMGLSFWRTHQDILRQASERFGVPEEIIVAIIGVETNYGRVTGTFRVFDTLVTLTFDYTRRADFFRGELEQFLLWIRENRLDVFGPHGSYAGAMGIPQFMPGSIRRHALDLDGDGRVDLSRSAADSVGSVANFLVNHGWQRGGPTHFKAEFGPGAQIGPFLEAGIEPRFRIAELERGGVRSTTPVAPDLPLALIEFPNGEQPSEHVLAAPNFYVITRYNRSSFYAMSVIELAARLRSEMNARNRAQAG